MLFLYKGIRIYMYKQKKLEIQRWGTLILDHSENLPSILLIFVWKLYQVLTY